MEFQALGLTKNEAKAYETLLRLGKSTAADISKESAVPYGRIYTVLASLEEKGLVKVLPEKTKSYIPADPQALKEYIQKRKTELEEAEKKITEYKSLYDLHEEEPVQIAKGKKNFYKLLKQMKKDRKSELSIKYTFETKPEWMRTKNKRNNLVLGRFDEDTMANIEQWKKINPNIKSISNKGVAVSIRDNDEILIALIKSNITLLIKDKPFVELMRTLFMNYYNTN